MLKSSSHYLKKLMQPIALENQAKRSKVQKIRETVRRSKMQKRKLG